MALIEREKLTRSKKNGSSTSPAKNLISFAGLLGSTAMVLTTCAAGAAASVTGVVASPGNATGFVVPGRPTIVTVAVCGSGRRRLICGSFEAATTRLLKVTSRKRFGRIDAA